MGKGNISVDKSMIKTVVDGKIIIPLPKVLVENRYYPMFSICSPTHCDDCSSKLHVNSHYTRFILSSYGTIARDVTYWFCPVSVLHQLDQKSIYPHYDFKHLTEKYFEIGMKLDDFLIQLVKYCVCEKHF